MQIRSWMTALALFSGLACATIAPSAGAAELELDGPTVAIENTVKLEIQISGLGAKGAKIEIKPAHPGCKFKLEPIKIPKGTGGDLVKLDTITVLASTTHSDRDCSFEITLTEPGRTPKTFRRGLQLAATTPGVATLPSRTLKCYLPATAIASKDDPKATKPRR